MSLLNNLPHVVRHERRQYAEDEAGYGKIDSLDIIEVGVPAWVQNASSADMVEAQKHHATAAFRIYFATRTAVPLRAGDYVYVTDGPSYVDRRFKFLAEADRSAGLGALWCGLFDLQTTDDPPELDS